MDPNMENGAQWTTYLSQPMNKLKSIPYRQSQLQRLVTLLEENTVLFEDALQSDSGCSSLEATNELNASLSIVKKTNNELKKRVRRRISQPNLRMRRKATQEPTGHGDSGGKVVLIIASTEYPILSVLPPLVSNISYPISFPRTEFVAQASAIASGNMVVVQLSRLLPTTNTLFRGLIVTDLDSSIVRVAENDPSEAFMALDEIRTEEIKTVTLCNEPNHLNQETTSPASTRDNRRKNTGGLNSLLSAVCISEAHFHTDTTNPFLLPFP